MWADVHVAVLAAWIPLGFYYLSSSSCGSESITFFFWTEASLKNIWTRLERENVPFPSLKTSLFTLGNTDLGLWLYMRGCVETEKKIFWQHLTGVTNPTNPEHRLIICWLCHGQFQIGLVSLSESPSLPPRWVDTMQWLSCVSAFFMMLTKDVTLTTFLTFLLIKFPGSYCNSKL